MKSHLALVAGLVLFVSTALAQAEDAAPVRSISVSGTVETKVAPDLINWRISLSDRHKVLSEAKIANDNKVKAVLALRKKLGVKEGDIETGVLSIRKEYERDEHGRQGAFKNFVVYRSVTIRQRDLKRFDEYIDSLVASADMEVSFGFESTKIHEVRADTRLRALKLAKDKAKKMADIVDAKLGQALTINEHANTQGYRSSNVMAQNSAFMHSTPGVDLASDTFIPGAIRVKMTVYAIFELE
jgi:uncharacterized protein YggE